jgi:hypothetical protein
VKPLALDSARLQRQADALTRSPGRLEAQAGEQTHAKPVEIAPGGVQEAVDARLLGRIIGERASMQAERSLGVAERVAHQARLLDQGFGARGAVDLSGQRRPGLGGLGE